jgi:hypothetical protein
MSAKTDMPKMHTSQSVHLEGEKEKPFCSLGRKFHLSESPSLLAIHKVLWKIPCGKMIEENSQNRSYAQQMSVIKRAQFSRELSSLRGR